MLNSSALPCLAVAWQNLRTFSGISVKLQTLPSSEPWGSKGQRRRRRDGMQVNFTWARILPEGRKVQKENAIIRHLLRQNDSLGFKFIRYHHMSGEFALALSQPQVPSEWDLWNQQEGNGPIDQQATKGNILLSILQNVVDSVLFLQNVRENCTIPEKDKMLGEFHHPLKISISNFQASLWS